MASSLDGSPRPTEGTCGRPSSASNSDKSARSGRADAMSAGERSGRLIKLGSVGRGKPVPDVVVKPDRSVGGCICASTGLLGLVLIPGRSKSKSKLKSMSKLGCGGVRFAKSSGKSQGDGSRSESGLDALTGGISMEASMGSIPVSSAPSPGSSDRSVAKAVAPRSTPKSSSNSIPKSPAISKSPRSAKSSASVLRSAMAVLTAVKSCPTASSMRDDRAASGSLARVAES